MNDLERLVSYFLETKAVIQGEAVAKATKVEIISNEQCRVSLPTKGKELMHSFLANAEMIKIMTNDLKRKDN